MTPSGRLAATLISSLVLGWRPLEACIRGEMDLEMAVVRWGAGLLVAWVAFGIISRLVEAYRAEAVADDESPAESAPEREPGRRLEDGPISAS